MVTVIHGSQNPTKTSSPRNCWKTTLPSCIRSTGLDRFCRWYTTHRGFGVPLVIPNIGWSLPKTVAYMLPFMLRGIPFCDPLCWSLLQHGNHIQIFVVVCLHKFTDNISGFFTKQWSVQRWVGCILNGRAVILSPSRSRFMMDYVYHGNSNFKLIHPRKLTWFTWKYSLEKEKHLQTTNFWAQHVSLFGV